MRSLKQRSNRRINSRKHQGGDGNHNIQSVGMPIQYFNPSAKAPAYYPSGHEMLTKQYVSGLGPVNAVNTTQPNACRTEMGPSLSAFSPYEDVSMMTGGRSAYRQIVNPLTNRKVSVSSKLGQQIIKQYINILSAGGPKTAEEIAAEHTAEEEVASDHNVKHMPEYVKMGGPGNPMKHDMGWGHPDDVVLSADHPDFLRQPYFRGHAAEHTAEEEIAAQHNVEHLPLYVGREGWDGKPMEHEPRWMYPDDEVLSMDHPDYFKQPYFRGHPYSTLDAKTLAWIQGDL